MLHELTFPASSRWPLLNEVAWNPSHQYDALHYALASWSARADSNQLPALTAHQQQLMQTLPPAQTTPHAHHHSIQGCLAAFSIVFLGEFGDKTFFTAALLAIRVGRLISFTGSMLALAAMSLIGVAIGSVFARSPPQWCSGLPVGELLGVVLLVGFGLSALRKATRETAQARGATGGSGTQDNSSSYSASNLEHNHENSHDQGQDGRSSSGSSSSSSTDGRSLSPQHSADHEYAEAEQAVAAAASRGLLSPPDRKALLSSVLEVAAVMFLAEWGDRSMLATVALGAAQSPWGVAVGATAAYAAATGLAVLGGSLAAKHVSEQTLDAVSGVLFLVFAAASLVTLL